MRRLNRVASGLFGLALLAAGLLIALEAALIAVSRAPLWLPLDRWYHGFSTTTLANRAVLGIAIGVGVVGLVILLLELRPWAPDRVRAGGDGGAPWWVSRRSVERRTATAADTVHGVAQARTDVRGRPQRWRLRLRAGGEPEQRDAVQRAVREELNRLNASADTAVDIALSKPRRRVA